MSAPTDSQISNALLTLGENPNNRNPKYLASKYGIKYKLGLSAAPVYSRLIDFANEVNENDAKEARDAILKIEYPHEVQPKKIRAPVTQSTVPQVRKMKFKEVQGSYKIYPDSYGLNKLDYKQFLSQVQTIAEGTINQNLNKPVKIFLSLCAVMGQYEVVKGYKYWRKLQERFIWSNNSKTPRIVYNQAHTRSAVSASCDLIDKQIDQYAEGGSAYFVKEIKWMAIHIVRFNPLRGSSYIQSPQYLYKKGCINVKNEKDNYCFIWSILSCLHYDTLKKDQQRTSKYETAKFIEFNEDKTIKSASGINLPENVKYPVSFEDIEKFEAINDFRINVYECSQEKEEIEEGSKVNKAETRPLRISDKESGKMVNLLLLSQEHYDKETKETSFNSHYIWIKDFSALCSWGRVKHHFCYKCLHGFTRVDLLEKHEKEGCPIGRDGCCLTSLPHVDKCGVEFTKYKACCKIPYTIYYDFETVLNKVEVNMGEASKIIQKHTPLSCVYNIISENPNDSKKSKTFFGANCAFDMLTDMIKESQELAEKMTVNNEIDMTEETEQAFQAATHCHICTKSFDVREIIEQNKISFKLSKETRQRYNDEIEKLTENKTYFTERIKALTIRLKLVDDKYKETTEETEREKLYKEIQTVHKLLIDCKIKSRTTDKELTDYRQKLNMTDVERSVKFVDNHKKVRDHDHFKPDNNYRGAAHEKCNLGCNLKHVKIPCIAHNAKNYDYHLIIKELSKINAKNISIIPTSAEKYMAISFNNLQFIDSCQFLSESLETLVNNLKSERKKFENDEKYLQYLKSTFPIFTREYEILNTEFMERENVALESDCFYMLLQKGIFPYSFMTGFDKLEHGKPSQADFFDQLSKQEIDDKEYKFFCDVWDKFKIKNMKEYTELYNKCDVALLADVFENFRNVCLTYYNMDPCHFFTLPGFSWQSMLRMTKIKIDSFNSEQLDMYLMIEKSKRGGVSSIQHRYARANNKYIRGDEIARTDDNYLMYLDANNLYGWAMSQFLPFRDYKWCNPEEWTQERILSLSDTSNTGYFFEVDLTYCEELHDLHNQYPVAPENITVNDKMLSPYAKALREELSLNSCNVGKLVPNLNNKYKYVLHYRNLKLYLSLGLRLDKVHRVLQFEQKDFLKSYIDFNTAKRAMAKNDFEKDLFKLMNNSVFGKTMENVRNRINYNVVNSEKRYNRLVSSPLFKSSIQFVDDKYLNPEHASKIRTERETERKEGHPVLKYEEEENEGNFLYGISMAKNKVVLDKPIIVGCSILDLSKVLMYDFHYNTILTKYGNNAQLLFTDTDSLCYSIKTPDIYEDFKEIKSQFDFSEYPEDHPLFDVANKKKVGLMKDECKGAFMSEFVGIRSKCYSFKIHGEDEEHKKLKGIKKSSVENYIHHENYYNCIHSTKVEDKKQSTTMSTIRSINHNIYTIDLEKTSLCAYDDKRFLLNDGISSYAYFHKEIKTVLYTNQLMNMMNNIIEN